MVVRIRPGLWNRNNCELRRLIVCGIMDAVESIIKSDIFFFITAVAVVVVSAVLLVALYYLIIVLRDISFLSKKAKEEGEKILDDASAFSGSIRGEGEKIVSDIKGFRYLVEKRGVRLKNAVDAVLSAAIKNFPRKRKQKK